jgi:hypothetical protein
MDEKEFYIWAEGYRATGQSSGAICLGTAKGVTFQDACKRKASEDARFNSYFNEEHLSYWGCRLFDNESDARRTFG